MTVLKLSPVEFRPSDSDVAVLFQVEFKRPSGHAARLFVAINGQYDIAGAITYLVRKFQPRAIEYQPSLFHTWTWEIELEKAVHEYNLTAS